MRKILGIDEAGRGCVIGPMVIAGVLISQEKLSTLAAVGARDSKALERLERELLAPQIERLAAATQMIILTPEQIDSHNMNALELQGMATLINDLKPDVVYLDAPVPPAGICNFIILLRNLLMDERVQLVAENKADAVYAVVGAASIIAKTTRDRFITQLKEIHGDFGWGYPGEPKTRAFLQCWFAEHGSFPDFVRTKWQTVQRLAQQKAELPLRLTGSPTERQLL